jgi:hypothetical protein
MPNGFHGPKNEWERMEAPLLRIDHSLQDFANSYGLRLSRNYHNWPERSLKWSTSRINKLIQIFLCDESKLTFTVWICASEDRGTSRFWKQQKLRDAVEIPEISAELGNLLGEGKAILDRWNETDLEPVSN